MFSFTISTKYCAKGLSSIVQQGGKQNMIGGKGSKSAFIHNICREKSYIDTTTKKLFTLINKCNGLVGYKINIQKSIIIHIYYP